jgi:nitroimidazol reductase NimA-like FMN-containing flavoprotein (pyridoxamine 5'-phosphate oxidase superfamily)
MFRDLTRKHKQLPHDECIKLLTEEKRGILSVNGDDGYPYGMPMNHFYNAEDGCIYFHCGKGGHRNDSLEKCGKVSFCVHDKGYTKDGEWALNIKSVIVFGKMEIIDDMDSIVRITEKLSHKFTNDDEYIQKEIKGFASKTLLLRLVPEHICGKLVNES